MNCSVAAFSFSLWPLQARRADACRARPKEKVRIQGLARGQLLMALRWTEASSSLWPPERKATPTASREIHTHSPLSQRIWFMSVWSPRLTCDRRGNGAAQGGQGRHSNLLRAVLGGTAVSGCHHVGFEEGALQVHVVVRHGFVHGSQDLRSTEDYSQSKNTSHP